MSQENETVEGELQFLLDTGVLPYTFKASILNESNSKSIMKSSEIESLYYSGRYYDAIINCAAKSFKERNVPFWVGIAKKYINSGSRVLELACGTGRIAIPCILSNNLIAFVSSSVGKTGSRSIFCLFMEMFPEFV